MLVAEVGYDRMTVEALAARAGVSKPTIYRRWPGGKKEIVVDAIRTKHAAPTRCPTPAACAATCSRCSATMVEHIDEDAHLAGGLISQLRDERGARRADARRDRRARAAPPTTC